MSSGVEERTVEVGEFKVNLATAGSGRCLVMLHGGDSRESWKSLEKLLPLSDEFRLVIPDLVGFGRSSRPRELPDYRGQALIVRETMDVLKIERASFLGSSWGGQVALEVAINWPGVVDSLILVSSTYDKSQLRRLEKARRPALILWAEDDQVAQVKAGYLLRDAIRTSRLEVFEPVAKDPRHDFTMAHNLIGFRSEEVAAKVRRFLREPAVVEPPELEAELRGMALKREPEGKE